ncbi:LuxR C-terminal-related transcriptional regulator [Hyphomonas johnsonii]|uniref:Putative DNA-binding response regulator n=1 Tax=Hyphomonas johnsonii MHS-2 TaxID=1280950 RepID=A0A059FBI8_9PROT|nr:response regulator transcription factor [Hyphomonas johnsonii]KCZ87962.1 putative DNA-binding response regulator [Hyphomonas johnsonii MHS-2]
MKRILIVEDISETRKWLCNAARAAFPGCEIRECSSAREGMFAASREPVDLAIVDLGLPDGSGQDVIFALSKAQPEALVIVATVMGDDASIISALSLGAQGYLLKDTPADMFVRQLAHIGDGVPALSPSIARRIVDHFRATAEVPVEGAGLTPRERDVLRLIGRGLRNAEAARALGLSDSTVASHIKSIYSKLGITTRAEAALRASRMGLTRD